MRVLLSFVGGNGHFEPLIPIARACVQVGHRVAFAGQAAMLPVIEAAGFTAFVSGGLTLHTPPERLPLLKLDLQREDRALRESFARRLAHERCERLLAICDDWQPDLIICDEIDFGAMIAAERLGLPYASVLVIAAGSFVRREVIGDALNEVRAGYGLPADPTLTMLSRYLVIAPIPPSYRDPAFPLPATAYPIRPSQPSATTPPPPITWSDAVAHEPLVYLTLGTVFNVESGDLFDRILQGLRRLPIRVIATVGREIDPAIFGTQPERIFITQYIAQSAILPQCHAVISHGGSGSVIGALAHGLSMVLLPMGADQPLNAARCTALGVACALDAVEATADDIQAAVEAVLQSPSYRQAAMALQEEIASLPTPESVMPLLERLATERQPIMLRGRDC